MTMARAIMLQPVRVTYLYGRGLCLPASSGGLAVPQYCGCQKKDAMDFPWKAALPELED